MAVGAVVARILTQYSDKGSKAAQKDIAKLGKSFDNFARNAARAFSIATAAVAAFSIKVGKDAVQAAIADQKSQALLANSLRNTTGATASAIASVEEYVSKLQLQVGVADDELRPSLARLAAVTSDVSTAQQLLSTALDVSAFSGSDLATATKAITKALAGSFRGLQTLVPGLDAAAIKSKDFAKILGQVQEITSGAAATRAGTLEYRLQILRIRYSEILETLGYALLPIIQEFAKTIQNEVLPQVEQWIAANKAGLIDGFKKAADAGVKLAKALIQIGFAVAENIDNIILLAKLFATMWVTSKVYNFAKAVGLVAAAFDTMRIAAAGAGAASAAATGAGAAGTIATTGTKFGVYGTLIAGLLAATTFGLSKVDLPGTRKRAKRLEAEREKSLAISQYVGAPGPSDLANMTTKKKSTEDTSMNKYLKFLEKLQKSQDKLNNAKKKQLTTEQKIINAMLKKYGLSLMTSETEALATATAIQANLDRQALIGGGPSVVVNITTPHGTAEDYLVTIDNGLNELQRRRGVGAGGGVFRQPWFGTM